MDLLDDISHDVFRFQLAFGAFTAFDLAAVALLPLPIVTEDCFGQAVVADFFGAVLEAA